eukprot:c48450_g1_i1 orf=214-381(+)
MVKSPARERKAHLCIPEQANGSSLFFFPVGTVEVKGKQEGRGALELCTALSYGHG